MVDIDIVKEWVAVCAVGSLSILVMALVGVLVALIIKIIKEWD